MKKYTPQQIARYFLAKADEDVGDFLSNLKLQKLVYYAQGVGTATRHEPLFDEPLEAWLHGPVVPDLYREYRDFGGGAIPMVSDLDIEEYAPEDRMILDDVYDFYGQYSAWRLREMTHQEAPWKDAYEQDRNNVIAIDALVNHFNDEVDDEYRAKYEQISKVEGEEGEIQ